MNINRVIAETMNYFWMIKMWVEFAFTRKSCMPVVQRIIFFPITGFLLISVVIINLFFGWCFAEVKKAWNERD